MPREILSALRAAQSTKELGCHARDRPGADPVRDGSRTAEAAFRLPDEILAARAARRRDQQRCAEEKLRFRLVPRRTLPGRQRDGGARVTGRDPRPSGQELPLAPDPSQSHPHAPPASS